MSNSCTIQMVAEAAGVSTATVSRVINRKDAISQKTIKKVENAILTLGFRANKVASSLALRRNVRTDNYLIGFIYFHLPSCKPENVFDIFFQRQVYFGIYDILRHAKYSVVTDFVEIGAESTYLSSLVGRNNFDGLIVKGDAPNDWLEKVSAFVPLVCLQPYHPTGSVSKVLENIRDAVFSGVQYLVKQGHQRIAFFAVADPGYAHNDMVLGYQEGLRSLGMDPTEYLLMPVPSKGQSFEDICANAMQHYWSMPQRPTAIIAMEVYLTALYKWLKNHDIKVPEDISLLSVGGNAGSEQKSEIDWTGFQEDGKRLGSAAADLLLDKLKNPQLPTKSILVEVKFKEGVTCAPPPSAK